MIEPIMETHPARKAILVYQPLEAAIAGILKKQDMRSDIRTQSRTRLVEWADITGNEDLLLSEIRPDQAAAISWLGSMHAAVEEFGDRAMPVNFEDFLEQPVEWLERIARFLGLEAVAQEIVQGYESVSGRYSKNTAWSYGPGKRAEQLERSREANAAMIDAGLKFAEVQLDRYPQLLVSKVRA